MFRQPFRVLEDSPFLGEARHVQDQEGFQEERPDVLEVLMEVITEAFTLYMETKSLSWSLAHSSFSSEGPNLDEQAELIFVHVDRLVHLVHGLGGSALHENQKMPFWHMKAEAQKMDQDITIMIQQVIKDHQRLARRLREAIAICRYHHERECRLALQRVLVETEKRTQRFVCLLERLYALSDIREVLP